MDTRAHITGVDFIVEVDGFMPVALKAFTVARDVVAERLVSAIVRFGADCYLPLDFSLRRRFPSFSNCSCPGQAC